MLALNDYANTAVPQNAGPRFGWLYMTNVEVALTVCVPVFMFGAQLGQSLSALNLLLVLLVSGIILALISSWSSYIGERTRLSTALLVERSFGQRGGYAVWIVLAICMFGWFGVQTELLAKGFMDLMQDLYPNVGLNKSVVTVLFGALMCSTAVLGIQAVGKLAQVAVPLLLISVFYAAIMALQAHGITPWLNHVPANSMAIGEGIAATVGAYSLAALCMPDIKRFSIDARHSIVSAIYSLGLFYPLFLLLIAIVSVLSNQPDFMKILLGAGFGSLTLVILLFATWTTNDINLYCASLSLARIFPKIKRQWLALISGAIGTTFATFGIFEHAIPLFGLLGVLLTPLLVIYSVEYLLGNLSREDDRPANWLAFVVWVTASVVGVLATSVEQWGLGLLSFTTIPAIDSLLVCAVFYPLSIKGHMILRAKTVK